MITVYWARSNKATGIMTFWTLREAYWMIASFHPATMYSINIAYHG